MANLVYVLSIHTEHKDLGSNDAIISVHTTMKGARERMKEGYKVALDKYELDYNHDDIDMFIGNDVMSVGVTIGDFYKSTRLQINEMEVED